MPRLPEQPQPFRAEVPSQEHQEAVQAERDIELLKTMGDGPQDRPLVAHLMRDDVLMREGLPRESKLGVFREMRDLMAKGGEIYNTEVALTLIDAIRDERDPALRTRYAAMLSHDLQQKYLPELAMNDPEALPIMERFSANRRAFEMLEEDPEFPQSYRNWTRRLLHPGEHLQVMNELFDNDPWTEIVPGIQKEITKIFEGSNASRPKREVEPTGNIRKLPLLHIPSHDKRELYLRLTGNPLPVYATWRIDDEYISPEIHSEWLDRFHDLIVMKEGGEITREQLRVEQNAILEQFIGNLNQEDQDEIARLRARGAEVDVRFTTEVGKYVGAPGNVTMPNAMSGQIEDIKEQLEAYRKEVDEEVADAMRSKEINSPKERKPTPEEVMEVKENMAALIRLGVYPKVTVERKHLASILKEGITARETAYQKGVKLIVGTLGTDPFLPEGQDRVVLELRVAPEDVEPRFTGPANRFDGVVAIRKDSVPPDQIHVIE